MFQWLRNLFAPKPPVKELPPRRELVQWLPGANMWVPFSAHYWQDRGYPRVTAWMLYKEGLELAHELAFHRKDKELSGGTAKPQAHTTRPADDESVPVGLTSEANLLLAAGEALCSGDVHPSDRSTDTTGFTGRGGAFGGGGADGGWDRAIEVQHATPEVIAPAADLSPSYDAGPSIDTSSSISDTSSSFDSSSNC